MKHSFMQWVAGGLVVSLLAASASAGIMYTVRESDNFLIRIDTDTLQFTPVGPLNMQTDFGDLAWDSSTSTLYLVDGWGGRFALWTVDTNTGQATLVGTPHGFNSMFGLAYDPTTDTLYGSQSTIGNGFFKIDQSNGSAQNLGNPGINLDSLAYDSRRDMLVGAEAGPGDLHNINRANGAPTEIFDGPFFDNCGMTYDSDKDVFWMIDWSGNLYQFDPNNGYARTQVLGGLGAHDGLAYVTEGGGKCQYTVTKSKAKGGCNACPDPGDSIETEAACQEVTDCRKKIKTTINCPQGDGACKIKGKRAACG